MPISKITAHQAQEKLSQDAILIDIREHDEFAREHIQNAVCVPFSQLQTSGLKDEQKCKKVIFYCKSGVRTQNCGKQLTQIATENQCETYILDGGLDAWKTAGFTVNQNKKAPLPMMRQVQIAAGSLILLGMLLGSTISPLFYLIATFVGLGLTFAGITGFCGMAVLLGKMPWNK